MGAPLVLPCAWASTSQTLWTSWRTAFSSLPCKDFICLKLPISLALTVAELMVSSFQGTWN